MAMNLFCEMNKLSLTKEIRETGMLREFRRFSRIYRRGERYRADKIGDRADSWPTPTLTSYNREENSFHLYLVFLWIKKSAKNETTLGSKPTFLRERVRRWWLRDGKNWAISKARVLVVLFFTHTEQIAWVSATSVSEVDLNLRPPSWLGWMKSFLITWNWSLSAITFLMNFPRVFKRTMGWKDLGLS